VHPPLETGFFQPVGEANSCNVILSPKGEESQGEILRHNASQDDGGVKTFQDDGGVKTSQDDGGGNPPQNDGRLRASPGARFENDTAPNLDYYLAVSHFVPYKRLDLVLLAFNGLERRLAVIGSGPLASQYQKLRQSDRISFWGSVSDEELRKAYSGARALIFPTEEDFGIVPLEAQACGAPVIAFRKGGALETVKSGAFFDEQTPESIREAVLRFEHQTFNRAEVSAKVQGFGREHFLQNMKRTVMEHFKKRSVSV
jgi:glycosyltransferase involved in cell wall biosynthesis